MIPEIMDSCASTSVLKSAKTSLRNSSSSPHCCMASGQSITSVCVDIFFYEPQDAQERIINDAIEMPMKQRKVVEAQVAAGYLLCVCCAELQVGNPKGKKVTVQPSHPLRVFWKPRTFRMWRRFYELKSSPNHAHLFISIISMKDASS